MAALFIGIFVWLDSCERSQKAPCCTMLEERSIRVEVEYKAFRGKSENVDALEGITILF